MALLLCLWPGLSAPSPARPAPTAIPSFGGEGAAERRQRGAWREKQHSCAALVFPPASLVACTGNCF